VDYPQPFLFQLELSQPAEIFRLDAGMIRRILMQERLLLPRPWKAWKVFPSFFPFSFSHAGGKHVTNERCVCLCQSFIRSPSAAAIARRP
jgi:hypothetical protein